MSSTELASLDELVSRLDWTPDEQELSIAQEAIDDASELARYHGRATWTNRDTAPPLVRRLVLRAATRHVKNPNGYHESRAGDETLIWSDNDKEMSETHFTADEQKILAELAGRANSGFHSVINVAWDPTPKQTVGYVPVDDGGGRPFPLFSSDEGPW